MNKKLVALAVAGVLAAPLAAQAQTANVTLYGRVNLDMEVVNGQAAQRQTNPNVYRVSSNSSRLGVRGTESLGGGLNAIFQIESIVRRMPAAARWPRAKPSSACKARGARSRWATSLPRTTTFTRSSVTCRP